MMVAPLTSVVADNLPVATSRPITTSPAAFESVPLALIEPLTLIAPPSANNATAPPFVPETSIEPDWVTVE